MFLDSVSVRAAIFVKASFFFSFFRAADPSGKKMTITIEQPQLGELLCFLFLCVFFSLFAWLAGVMAV